MKNNKFNISHFFQKEIKQTAALALRKIENPGRGIGKELFETIISVVPQITIEAVIVDNLQNPSKVLVTPRHELSACHLPGGFIRYGESFSDTLLRFIKDELKTGVKNFKDTGIKYNCLAGKEEKLHIIGLYFLVELTGKPHATHEWINYIPQNLIFGHKTFLKNYFHWKPGKALWH